MNNYVKYFLLQFAKSFGFMIALYALIVGVLHTLVFVMSLLPAFASVFLFFCFIFMVLAIVYAFWATDEKMWLDRH